MNSPLLLSFAVLLLIGVLISERASRTVISTAVLFLVAGAFLGQGGLGVLTIESGDPTVKILAELALFSVLYTDGMRVRVSDLRAAWNLPGRALVLGLPLTFVLTALLAHVIVGLGWPESFLLGAVLAPTDPVFASAIVGREGVPGRLRHLLNVESGLNDGLALPMVLILLAVAGGGEAGGWQLAGEIGLGVAIGVLIPLIALTIERAPFLQSHQKLQPLLTAAIGLLVLAVAGATHANLFLAAFSAGITVVNYRPASREEFEQFGNLVAEQLKLAAILVFGALITPAFLFRDLTPAAWIFAALVLLVARPAALYVSFLGAHLPRGEQIAAMWFGPKGFASVVYGILVLESGIDEADHLFHLVALAVFLSILAHSSTDVVVAEALERRTA